MSVRNIIGRWLACVSTGFFNFRGRADRGEYWSFVLVSVLLIAAAVVSDNLFGTEFRYPYRIYGWITTACFLSMLVPLLSVTTRRLHDSGRDGWWLVWMCSAAVGLRLSFFVSDTLMGTLNTLQGMYASRILFSAALFLMTVWTVAVMCLDSQLGDNRFGPNPKGEH